MGFFKFKNISLDSYEANNLVKTSFGTKSDEHIEDNIIKNKYEFVRCYQEALQRQEYGAFLIITGKQYIFAKCYDDGNQGHLLSLTKTFLELEGKESDLTPIQAGNIYKNYGDRFLIFEIDIKKDEMTRKRDMLVRTILNHPTISKEEYQAFKMFLDEYGEVFSRCNFEYSFWDKPKGKLMPVKDLKQIEEFLRNAVDENTKPNTLENGEKIVGVPIKNENKEKIL